MRRLIRGEAGQASVEWAGSVWLLLFAALAAWQLALTGWTAVAASNAARTAARDLSRVGSTSQASTDAHSSLSGDGVDAGSTITFDGGNVTVTVKVPMIFPGLSSPVTITENADMPRTG